MPDITDQFDVVIIGGGPAGMSAGLWCSELALSSLVIEREREFGGQLLSIHAPVENYLGIRTRTGRELYDHFREQFEKRDIAVRLEAQVDIIDFGVGLLQTVGGSKFSFGSLIIATGVRRRKLNIPGEEKFFGRGVLESGAKENELTTGKTVMIVGGGDAAVENVLILSEQARDVVVVHRGDSFSAREEFRSAASKRTNVSFLMNSQVTAINGNAAVESVEVCDASGKKKEVKVDYILIRVGIVPNSELFTDHLDHDQSGYLLVDADCRTSIANVFAIGDVASPNSPTISTAVGMGATAAKSIRKSSVL